MPKITKRNAKISLEEIVKKLDTGFKVEYSSTKHSVFVSFKGSEMEEEMEEVSIAIELSSGVKSINFWLYEDPTYPEKVDDYMIKFLQKLDKNWKVTFDDDENIYSPKEAIEYINDFLNDDIITDYDGDENYLNSLDSILFLKHRLQDMQDNLDQIKHIFKKMEKKNPLQIFKQVQTYGIAHAEIAIGISDKWASKSQCSIQDVIEKLEKEIGV